MIISVFLSIETERYDIIILVVVVLLVDIQQNPFMIYRRKTLASVSNSY